MPDRVPKRLRPATGYVLAGAGVVLATVLNVVLVDQVAGQFTVFLFYSFAVFFAAQYGVGPGLLATVGGVIAGWFLFLPPARTVEFSHSSLLLGGLFFGQSLAIVGVVSLLESALGRVRQQRADLERLTAELQAAAHEKDQFLGMLSHELRGAVHGITLRAEAALHPDDRAGAAGALALVAEVGIEARRLRAVLDDMLVLGREETDIARELEPCHLGHFLRAELPRLSAMAKPSEVVLVVSDELSLVETAPNFLEQVVWNLVTNAKKYGGADGPIEIWAREEGGGVLLSVLDRGPGVPPAELGTIFQPYYRGAKTAGKPGFGVGLAVVARLVRSMGATVEARLREGGGLEVRLTLPVSADEGER